jgi:hypothetical protein
MPLVPYESAIASRASTLPGQAQPLDNQPESKSSGLDLAAAALRQNNIAAGGYSDHGTVAKVALGPLGIAVSDFLTDINDAKPGYDPLTAENLAGYEQFADRFIPSESPAQSERIKARIGSELADQKVINEAGGAGLAASIAAGVVDPVTLASLAIPVAGEASAATRIARIGRTVLNQAAFDTAQEALLHADQELRTPEQSLLNVGAGVLFTGALGTLATRMSRAEFKDLATAAKGYSDSLHASPGPVESTGGAARVGFGTTLADETVAPGGEAILKTVGKISPLGRVMQSTSKRARILMQELADVPFLLNKHLRGIDTPPSVEGLVKRGQADRYRLLKETDASWAEYKARGGTMDRGRFSEELAATLRRGDQSIEPELTVLAKKYRKFFDQSLKDLKAAKLLPEEAGAEFAMSYLPRMYDHAKIRANRIAFEQALEDHFSRTPGFDKAEVRAAVADVIDTVNGSLREHAQIAQGFVGRAGALEGRTLSVPDEVLEPWLVNDVDKIIESYVRTVNPQLEITRKFGDLDMRQQFQDVRDEFVAMRERAKTNESKANLTKEMEHTLEDLQAVRDQLLGKYGRPANPDSILVRSGRVFRTLNYLRLLGGQVLSSLPDAGRIVARHGLVNTAKKIGELVTNSGVRNLTKNEAQRVGTALEYVLNTRADTLGEIGNELASSKLDRVLRRESNRFSRLTGMASWNSALKTVAVGLEQDAIIRAARGGALSKFQRGQLASLGVGDRMLTRISKQLDTHGKDVEGLWRANAEKWTDREAADSFETALVKSADQVVLTKGIADVPLFMSKDMGKTLLQFKSFGMASVNRLLVPMAQGLAHGDVATINGAWMMMALGALANATRDVAAGFRPSTDPTRVAIEAFDRAGFTAMLAEPFDLVSGTFGGPRFGRFSSQSIVETAAGPTFGTAEDIRQTLQGMFTEGGKFDPELKQQDLYRFRKLLPYQNLFYLRRLVNALEGEFGESVGASGAGSKGFIDRATETKDLAR